MLVFAALALRRLWRRRRRAATPARADTASSDTASGAIESNPDNEGVTVTIGSKNFTEQKVLGEIYAQGLEAAGYTVEDGAEPRRREDRAQGARGRRDQRLPGVLRHGADSFFGVPSDEIPLDSQKAYDKAKIRLAQKKITDLRPTPFTSSNEVGTTQAKAKKSG